MIFPVHAKIRAESLLRNRYYQLNVFVYGLKRSVKWSFGL